MSGAALRYSGLNGFANIARYVSARLFCRPVCFCRSALFKPWHYESWWSLGYANSTARPALNRLLRLPLPP